MRNFLKQVVDSQWFPLLDLLIVLGSGAIWYFRPEFGWKILLIALLPWCIRLFAGRRPFRFTPFDIPILFFLITALVGAQVAYDQVGSWAKFWIILAAVLFFYALAGQPHANTWIIVGAMTVLGVVISSAFLLFYDWQANPVKLDVINRIGRAWMTIRPSVSLISIRDEDIVSNILLVLSPFPIILFFHTASQLRRNPLLLLFSILSIILFLVGLGMASTLQAVLFSCAGLLIVFWWGLNTWLDQWGSDKIRMIFFISSGLVLLIGAFLLIEFPDGMLNFVREIPQFDRFENRFMIIDNTLHLSEDYLLTGGGLGAFAGLYSLYILDIPFLFISFGSNLFLQIAVEHGVIGSIAYLSIVVGGIFILLDRLFKKNIYENKSYLVYMSMLGFAALLVVGMFDAILYNGLSIFVLFILPGFVVFSQYQSQRKVHDYIYSTTLFTVTLFLFIFTLGNKLPSVYYANLGAIKMAQLDLTGWTYDQSITPQGYGNYGAAVQDFEKALKLNPQNQTANYRLGLLAYRRGDYLSGGPYLEKALFADPGNRGIIKSLGYSYVWLGNIDQAEKYLDEIPEAGAELEYFSWWWGTKNRNDLSEYAIQMAKILKSSQ